MIRPGALATLLRWREAAVGLAALALGLWWAFTAFGLLRWAGILVAVGGAAILREAALRLRRPEGGGGPGLVEVDERRITFLSARGGGSLSIDALGEVEVATTERAAFWVLTERSGDRLSIPASATGSAQVFDALAALPGFDADRAAAALRRPDPGRSTLWRHPEAAGPGRLH